MPNLSSLAPLTTAATALSNLVLVSPQSVVGYQPQNLPTSPDAQQPPTFLFHYEGEQAVDLDSDITDHYVEDNTAVQDQIALKPEMYTTQGFIGELNNVVPAALAPVKFLADKLTTVVGYQPQLSETALVAYNQAFFLYQVGKNAANSAVSAWSSIGNLISGSDGQTVIGPSGITPGNVQNEQQMAFQKLYGYWRERRLFTVQTPWAVFTNMAILKFRTIQDEETKVITNFNVTFKMIRVAQTGFAGNKTLGMLFQGRAASQAADKVNLGVSSPVPSSSLRSGLSTMGLA